MSTTSADVTPMAFTVPQVAAVLGIPLRDARNLVEDGMLGSVGVGIRRIVPRAELVRFLETNLVRRPDSVR